LSATNSRQQGALISGDLRVLDARYQMVRQHAAAVAELEGVHWKGQPAAPTGGLGGAGPPSRWKLDVRVRADNRILVNGMGLESEWRSDVRVEGDIRNPTIVGEARSVRGSYSFGGRRLALNDSTI